MSIKTWRLAWLAGLVQRTGVENEESDKTESLSPRCLRAALVSVCVQSVT